MPEFMPLLVGGVVIVALILLVVSNIRVVPQASVYVIERLGTYHATWTTGCCQKSHSLIKWRRWSPLKSRWWILNLSL